VALQITLQPTAAILLADLKQLPPTFEKEAILKLSVAAEAEVRRGADKHTKTGRLFQSVYNREISNGREVGHDPERAPHALFVVGGTRPHVIEPKNRKVLRFPVGSGGNTRFVFARRVNHPGYKGDDYMTPAANAAMLQLQSIIDSLKG